MSMVLAADLAFGASRGPGAATERVGFNRLLDRDVGVQQLPDVHPVGVGGADENGEARICSLAGFETTERRNLDLDGFGGLLVGPAPFRPSFPQPFPERRSDPTKTRAFSMMRGSRRASHDAPAVGPPDTSNQILDDPFAWIRYDQRIHGLLVPTGKGRFRWTT